MLILLALTAQACTRGSQEEWLAGDPANGSSGVATDATPMSYYASPRTWFEDVLGLLGPDGTEVPTTIEIWEDWSFPRLRFVPDTPLEPDTVYTVGVGMWADVNHDGPPTFSFVTGSESTSPAVTEAPELAFLDEFVDVKPCGDEHYLDFTLTGEGSWEVQVGANGRETESFLGYGSDVRVGRWEGGALSRFGDIDELTSVGLRARRVAPNGEPGPWGDWEQFEVTPPGCGCQNAADPAGLGGVVLGVLLARRRRARSSRSANPGGAPWHRRRSSRACPPGHAAALPGSSWIICLHAAGVSCETLYAACYDGYPVALMWVDPPTESMTALGLSYYGLAPGWYAYHSDAKGNLVFLDETEALSVSVDGTCSFE